MQEFFPSRLLDYYGNGEAMGVWDDAMESARCGAVRYGHGHGHGGYALSIDKAEYLLPRIRDGRCCRSVQEATPYHVG